MIFKAESGRVHHSPTDFPDIFYITKVWRSCSRMKKRERSISAKSCLLLWEVANALGKRQEQV